MSLFSDAALAHSVVTYGPWAVFALVALESAGVPMPGEAVLVSAAVLAGTSGEGSIGFIVFAAAVGAILGDNCGYWVGRTAGNVLLHRYGRHVGLGEARLRLGQYLFRRYGGAIVFFGRFVAFLRAFAAVLAGANRMPWGRFLVFNAAGGVIWAAVFGLGGYALGTEMHTASRSLGLAALALAGIAIAGALLLLRRHAARLQAEADLAFITPAEQPPIRTR
jgi:membrane protein DedA with SNARE-associated domain